MIERVISSVPKHHLYHFSCATAWLVMRSLILLFSLSWDLLCTFSYQKQMFESFRPVLYLRMNYPQFMELTTTAISKRLDCFMCG